MGQIIDLGVMTRCWRGSPRLASGWALRRLRRADAIKFMKKKLDAPDAGSRAEGDQDRGFISLDQSEQINGDWDQFMPTQPKAARPRRHGFSLVEILIVTALLGIMAAIAIPQFANAGRDSQQIAFVGDIREYAKSAVLYMEMTGQYLEDSSSGQMPAGWGPYVDANRWTQPTPIGGVWDVELDSHGIKAGLGVHFNGPEVPDDVFMQEIDAIFDDGDLNTGAFRKIAADRYYYILKAS